MSYDFFVYGSEALSHDDVATRMSNIRGLSFDPAESGPSDAQTWGFLIHRGTQQNYSFTVEGPYPDTGEDIDERQASVVIHGIKYRYDISVEGGGPAAEIPHAWAFAKKLARAVSGVAIDAQTDRTWPEPKTPPLTAYEEYYKHLSPGESIKHVTAQWYFIQDEDPVTLGQKYLDVCREHLPQALPGNYQLSMGRRSLERPDDDASFLEALQSNKMPWLQATGSAFVQNLGFSKLVDDVDSSALHVGAISLSLSAYASKHEGTVRRLRPFFLALSERLGAFFASAEITRSHVTTEKVKQTEEASNQWTRGMWRGLPAHPVWWSYFGPLYSELVRPHLTGNVEEADGRCFTATATNPSTAMKSWPYSQGRPPVGCPMTSPHPMIFAYPSSR
ncbi:hypothetical protein OCL88_15815 [Paenarthrobacter sp. PAE-2]|uniref:hypothetical protein n=1 Tax=Paenarthrobacter sp. PAE-2 TaxID=2982532 RepID=UPI00222FB123|nr:hypothetical protein [Paenarthrobacter sp. PAE-2]MCW3767946.1 hypothetical protein [Paenarthrobacter sp. PAE-2]